MTTTKTAKPAAKTLSYERLLQILQALPKEESDYVLAFVLNNEKKTEYKLAQLRAERRGVEEELEYLREQRSKLQRKAAREREEFRSKAKRSLSESCKLSKEFKESLMNLSHRLTQFQLTGDMELGEKVKMTMDAVAEARKRDEEAREQLDITMAESN